MPNNSLLTRAQEDELKKLISSGQKIVAVKRFREITGVGLQEALHAVTRLAEGAVIEGVSRVAAELPPKVRQEAEAAALAAIREGSAIEGIKRYRQLTNASLKEAKDAIDALRVVHESNGRVNPKLARTLITMLEAGQVQEAATQLMSGAGYDEPEAQAVIASLRRHRTPGSGCVRGCVMLLIILFLLAGAVIAYREGLV